MNIEYFHDDSMLCKITNVNINEVLLRKVCDYWIKDDNVYEKVAAYKNCDTCVIELNQVNSNISNKNRPLFSHRSDIVIEVREYTADSEVSEIFPLLESIEFAAASDALTLVLSDKINACGKWWFKTSAEADDDRKRFVIYVTA